MSHAFLLEVSVIELLEKISIKKHDLLGTASQGLVGISVRLESSFLLLVLVTAEQYLVYFVQDLHVHVHDIVLEVLPLSELLQIVLFYEPLVQLKQLFYMERKSVIVGWEFESETTIEEYLVLLESSLSFGVHFVALNLSNELQKRFPKLFYQILLEIL